MSRAYAIAKMECIKSYKESYLKFLENTRILNEFFGVSTTELHQIQQVALAEAKQTKDLRSLSN